MRNARNGTSGEAMPDRRGRPGVLWWATALVAVTGAALTGAWAGRRLELWTLRERAETIGRVLAALERDASESDRGERLAPPSAGRGNVP